MSVARIELATTRLSGECSTTELYALFWNGWARTNAYSYQKQMPYHLATFHYKKLTTLTFYQFISGQYDSNIRPSEPKSDTLPDYAMPRDQVAI